MDDTVKMLRWIKPCRFMDGDGSACVWWATLFGCAAATSAGKKLKMQAMRNSRRRNVTRTIQDYRARVIGRSLSISLCGDVERMCLMSLRCTGHSVFVPSRPSPTASLVGCREQRGRRASVDWRSQRDAEQLRSEEHTSELQSR